MLSKICKEFNEHNFLFFSVQFASGAYPSLAKACLAETVVGWYGVPECQCHRRRYAVPSDVSCRSRNLPLPQLLAKP